MFYKGHDIISGFIIGILRMFYAEFIRDLSRIYLWIMRNLASIVFPWTDTYVKKNLYFYILYLSLIHI